MHRILRQTVEIRTASRSDGLRVQDRLANALRAGPPGLERAFDRAASDRLLRIDRIELDLGRIGGPDWLDRFLARLAEKAEAALAGMAPGAVPSTPRGAEAEETQSGEMRAPGDEDDRVEALAAFLAIGRLPWWFRGDRGRRMVARLAEGLGPAARRRIAAVVAASPAALRRAVVHLPAPALARLLESARPGLPAARLAAALPELERAVATSLTAEQLWFWRAAFWEPLFLPPGAGPSPRSDPEAVARHWLDALELAAPGTWRRLRDGLGTPGAPAPVPSLPGDWQAALHRAIRSNPEAVPHPASRGRASPDPVADTAERRPVGDRASPKSDRAGQGARADGPAAAPGAARDEAEGLPVTGAGVVILHPFLAELFGHLGFVEDSAFVDEPARHRAVQLLGYLAFGEPEPFEADLTLMKLIAAMRLDEVLLPLALAPAEIEAADALLAAVLGHWTALRSSSAAWLRAQFLMRDGTLRPVDAGWTLVVERRAQDVLLGRLPWGLGVVRLPWANEMLHVNWND